jgi:hypothetical protein
LKGIIPNLPGFLREGTNKGRAISSGLQAILLINIYNIEESKVIP